MKNTKTKQQMVEDLCELRGLVSDLLSYVKSDYETRPGYYGSANKDVKRAEAALKRIR